MVTPATTFDRWSLLIWGWLVVSLGKIWIDRKWPGSTAAGWASFVSFTYFLVWFGSRAWMGYQRRRAYWTADSWRRYLRMAVWPIVAFVLLFAELSEFDNSVTGGVFGAPRSGLRTLWTLIDLTLMISGALGFVALVEWMARGDASEQFNRTSWFRWGNTPS